MFSRASAVAASTITHAVHNLLQWTEHSKLGKAKVTLICFLLELANVNQKRLRLLQGIAAISILATSGIFITNGRPPFEATSIGFFLGGYAFLGIAAILLVYWGFRSFIDGNVNQKRLHLLQGIAAISILATIVVFVTNGRPPFEAILNGFFLGGYSFLGMAAIVLACWGFQSLINSEE